jgi:hypothetical protein
VRLWWPAFTPRRGLAFAALALLVALAALIAISPAARGAVAERLGLRGVRIFYLPEPTPTPLPAATAVPRPPTALPVGGGASPAPSAAPTSIRQPPTTARPSGTPLPLSERLDLGTPVSLNEARSRAGFRVLAPTLPDYARPDLVLYRPFPPGGQVALVYLPRSGLPESHNTGVGLLLTEFRGSIERPFVEKGLGPGTRLEQVSVSGGSGFWIAGELHVFIYRDAGGDVRDEERRLAGNVLLWEQGGLTLRIEGEVSKDEALRIAASMR